MKTTLVSKENNRAKLTMEFTAEEFDAACDKAYRKNRGQFRINGFRQGKAPRKIIETHYGEGVFFEDAINELFGDNYADAVDENKLDVIDRPNVDFGEIGKGKPLTMDIEVDLFPIVEVKDYKGVEVDEYEDKVSDEDVDRSIGAMQKRNARMAVVERPVANGDTVTLDYAGFAGDEQFEGGTAERQELKIGSGTFIPGFEEQLIGANTGDDVDVNVTFPEDYQAEELAGRDAVFHCKIHEIKEEQLPELDDEFAKDVSEYDTMDELREETRKDMQKARDAQAVSAAKDAVARKVHENNPVEVPKNMIEDEIDQLAQEMEQQLMYQGLRLEQYLQFTGKDMAGFREEVREDAENRAGSRIVLVSIADKEGIEVTDEDFDAEVDMLTEQSGMDKEQVREILQQNRLSVDKDLLVRKVIDMLYDEAKITRKDLPRPDVTEAEDTEE